MWVATACSLQGLPIKLSQWWLKRYKGVALEMAKHPIVQDIERSGSEDREGEVEIVASLAQGITENNPAKESYNCNWITTVLFNG
ncbi:hypothetical protein SUGI_0536520 [Cryptomeria japonica]|nr:hypothetical protein SUGI_0536520 [Cryptomeria japonica]